MNIVSEIWTWQEGNRIYSRLTTNVCARRFMAKPKTLALMDSAEAIHAYFGDRVDGGNGYEVLWKQRVTWEFLSKELPNL